MIDTVRIFVGFDPRESLAYHVCSQSLIEKASMPLEIHPLSVNMLHGFDGTRGGSNSFNTSRFLVPMLCNYQGWAIFIDGDMVVDVDIAELWAWARTHESKAVAVVKHDYKTKNPTKYIGTPMRSANVDYERKNWSSVVLWNCAHPGNRLLDEAYIRETSPQVLHRFKWLTDSDIGELSAGWNYLVGEQAPSSAHLYHYTLGVPGIKHYANDHASWKWHQALLSTLACAGEEPIAMVIRSDSAVGS